MDFTGNNTKFITFIFQKTSPKTAFNNIFADDFILIKQFRNFW